MEEYSGWTNYETWLVKLWIDNDEAISINVSNLCKKKFEFESMKADALKDMIEECIDEDEASLKLDLISSALGRVNWKEICESYN